MTSSTRSEIIEHSGATTELSYDPNGNLLSVKDARNQTTSFTYDNMDRVVSGTDPLQGPTSTETYSLSQGYRSNIPIDAGK